MPSHRSHSRPQSMIASDGLYRFKFNLCCPDTALPTMNLFWDVGYDPNVKLTASNAGLTGFESVLVRAYKQALRILNTIYKIQSGHAVTICSLINSYQINTYRINVCQIHTVLYRMYSFKYLVSKIPAESISSSLTRV